MLTCACLQRNPSKHFHAYWGASLAALYAAGMQAWRLTHSCLAGEHFVKSLGKNLTANHDT